MDGFYDALQRITDTTVSVISAVKGNKAAEQAAQQQVQVRQQDANTVKYLIWGFLGLVTLGGIYLIFRRKG